MIDHKTRIRILTTHLKEEQLKNPANIWGREIKILKGLTIGRYEDADFWLGMGLGFKLNSFAWFKSAEGQAHLESSWRLYQLYQAEQDRINTNLLDNSLNSAMMESNPTPETEVAVAPKRKLTSVDWADSET
mgnify:CR=1 FL=1